jgi:hypothetical protein
MEVKRLQALKEKTSHKLQMIEILISTLYPNWVHQKTVKKVFQNHHTISCTQNFLTAIITIQCHILLLISQRTSRFKMAITWEPGKFHNLDFMQVNINKNNLYAQQQTTAMFQNYVQDTDIVVGNGSL